MSFLDTDPRRLGFALVDKLLLSLNDDLDLGEANRVLLGSEPTQKRFAIEELKPDRLKGIDVAELTRLCRSLATGYHEMRHVHQASNTALGLFLTATQRQLAMIMPLQLKEFRDHGITRLALPLLSATAHELAEPPRCRPLVKEARSRLNAMVTQLLDLAGNSQVTVGEALERDVALGRQQPGRENNFWSRLPSELPSSPRGLTLHHLLEGEARLFDTWALALAAHVGVPLDITDAVLRQLSMEALYTHALEIFLDETKGRRTRADLNAIAATFDLAMWPVLARGGADNAWEDIQPGWRFLRICQTLREVAIPEDPLDDFVGFCDAVCPALGWAFPQEAMEHRVQDTQLDRWGDPVLNDLYRRHQFFCAEALRTHSLPFFPDYETPGFFDRFDPWIVAPEGRFGFRNYPKDMTIQAAGATTIMHQIGWDVLFRSDFREAQALHERMHRHLVTRREWTQERLKFEFQEYIDAMVTGDGKCEIVAEPAASN